MTRVTLVILPCTANEKVLQCHLSSILVENRKKEYDQFVEISRSSGSQSLKDIAQSILIENGDLSTTSMTPTELS